MTKVIGTVFSNAVIGWKKHKPSCRITNSSSVEMTLILFTTQAPNPLAAQLSQQGHQVFEAIAISEVLALAEQHPTAEIIIDAGVAPGTAKVIQQHYPSMHGDGTYSFSQHACGTCSHHGGVASRITQEQA
jgi:hypothetical protein